MLYERLRFTRQIGIKLESSSEMCVCAWRATGRTGTAEEMRNLHSNGSAAQKAHRKKGRHDTFAHEPAFRVFGPPPCTGDPAPAVQARRLNAVKLALGPEDASRGEK